MVIPNQGRQLVAPEVLRPVIQAVPRVWQKALDLIRRVLPVLEPPLYLRQRLAVSITNIGGHEDALLVEKRLEAVRSGVGLEAGGVQAGVCSADVVRNIAGGVGEHGWVVQVNLHFRIRLVALIDAVPLAAVQRVRVACIKVKFV